MTWKTTDRLIEHITGFVEARLRKDEAFHVLTRSPTFRPLSVVARKVPR
jgi:hypothetical protein